MPIIKIKEKVNFIKIKKTKKSSIHIYFEDLLIQTNHVIKEPYFHQSNHIVVNNKTIKAKMMKGYNYTNFFRLTKNKFKIKMSSPSQ